MDFGWVPLSCERLEKRSLEQGKGVQPFYCFANCAAFSRSRSSCLRWRRGFDCWRLGCDACDDMSSFFTRASGFVMFFLLNEFRLSRLWQGLQAFHI